MGRRWIGSADGEDDSDDESNPAKKFRRSNDDDAAAAVAEEEEAAVGGNCSKNARSVRYRDGTEDGFESSFQAVFVVVVDDDDLEIDAAECGVRVFPVRQ